MGHVQGLWLVPKDPKRSATFDFNLYLQNRPELYVYTEHNGMHGDYPARNIVYTLHTRIYA